jgi:glutathione S-transferase
MAERIGIEQAATRGGTRLVLLAGFPSPWSVAAKAIFDVKRIPYTRAQQTPSDPPEALVRVTGQASYPAVLHEREKPRSGWAEILLLAERLAPEPALVPSDALARAQLFGFAHEICGEQGLGGTMRLLMIHAGQQASPPSPISGYLAGKYGYSPEAAAAAPARAAALLRMLSAQLARERSRGNGYLLGASLTALDLYWAAFSNLLAPLSDEQSPLPAPVRAMLGGAPPEVMAALDPALVAHRDFVFAKHVGLPLDL